MGRRNPGMAVRRNEHKKRIPELITQYKLHPELQDIFVEGSWDKRLVEWVLGRAGITDFVVYDIDSVFITPDLLARHGFDRGQDGKKERVVTLAYELQDHVTDSSQVSCIADKDYDILLGRNYESPLLLTTDYSCQEMYFMNEAVIAKFLALVVGCPVSASHLLDNVFEILPTLHVIRTANLDLRWGIEWLPPETACRMDGNVLVFQTDVFIHKYLNKGARLAQKPEFIAKCEELRGKLTTNPLNHASKDHLFMLLAEILPRFCKEPAMHQPKYIARSLAGCVEYEYLVAQPMYATLVSRLSPRVDEPKGASLSGEDDDETHVE
jgi:hypothetical protein